MTFLLSKPDAALCGVSWQEGSQDGKAGIQRAAPGPEPDVFPDSCAACK